MNELGPANPLDSYAARKRPVEILPPPRWYKEPERPKQRLWVHVVLFFAALLTTTITGAAHAASDSLLSWEGLVAGLPFAISLMSILLVHEMGHYVLAKAHGVEASLPYFIPAPPVIVITGTFGAFIRLRESPSNRNALFDVGAAGPWAGILVAIPVSFLGLLWSDLVSIDKIASGELGLELGEPLLFQLLSWIVFGPIPEGMTVQLHPVALAGWVGFLVTFLNLLPIGQLDGGHVAYALFGRHHRHVAHGFLGIVLLLGLTGWNGWLLWVALLLWIGVEHPPTLDAWIGLDPTRRIGAILTIGLFAVTFMPEPLRVVEPPRRFEGERTPIHWHSPETGPPDFRFDDAPSREPLLGA